MSRDGWLPPGVEEWDIPGNRPEDIRADKILERVCDACPCDREQDAPPCNYEAHPFDCPRVRSALDDDAERRC